MEDSLEDRISAIENSLGINENTDMKPSDFDVTSIQRRIRDLGLSRIMKIPIEKLKSLKNFNRTSGPLLNDRLKAIEFCEDLIRRRVELLSEFDERLKVVLDTSKVSQVLNQDMTLNEVHDGVYHALEEWKKYTTEINKFKLEYFSLIAACQNYLDEIEVLITAIESEAA